MRQGACAAFISVPHLGVLVQRRRACCVARSQLRYRVLSTCNDFNYKSIRCDCSASSSHRNVAILAEDVPEDDKWPAVVAACSGATFMAALQRVALPVLAVGMLQELQVDLVTMGNLQSAVLIGYVAGQVPSGLLADRYGGLPVLTLGLLLWSLSTMAIAGVGPQTAHPLTWLMVLRGAMGLGQSCMMPAVAATVARAIPVTHRARSTSIIYAAFSLGSVVGLSLSPVLSQQLGWPAVFGVYGALGMIWACGTYAMLPSSNQAVATTTKVAESTQSGLHRGASPTLQHGGDDPPISSTAAHDISAGQPASRHGFGWMLQESARGTMAAFLWVHGVIGYGFFIIQLWMPLYLASLPAAPNLSSVGSLSALAWTGAAVSGVVAGWVADHMQAQGAPKPRVRKLMHGVATLGPALSLMPLAIMGATVDVPLAVGCLTSTLALQGFNSAGFHSYVQDVVPKRAGEVLGVTNTSSTLVGIVGTVATGWLANNGQGFATAFLLTAGMYLSSFLVWMLVLKGQLLEAHVPVKARVAG